MPGFEGGLRGDLSAEVQHGPPLTDFERFLSAMLVIRYFLDKSSARAHADATTRIHAIEASAARHRAAASSQSDRREEMRAKHWCYW